MTDTIQFPDIRAFEVRKASYFDFLIFISFSHSGPPSLTKNIDLKKEKRPWDL